MNRNTIAVVGATSAPVRGLVHAILGDKAGRFAARVITLDVNTAPAAALGALGAELVVGHIGASVGLKRGFDGAYGAFYFRPVLNPPALQKELAEIAAMAQAAKDAGLRHFIWATLGDAKSEIAEAFKTVGVPATVLHTFGNLTALRRESGGEELGRLAYGIFKSGEYIGQTVPIGAELLIEKRRSTVREPVVPAASSPASALGITVETQAPFGAGAGPEVATYGSPSRVPDGEITKQMTGLAPGIAEAASAPAPRSRRVRPWMAIPAIAAIALFGVAYLRTLPLQDAAAPATLEASEAPRPRSPVIAPVEGHDPPVPTVTSRWEQERAAAKRAAAAGKMIGMATPAPPSSSAKHVRQKRRDSPHHREQASEGPLPSPPLKSSGPPEPPVVAPRETPTIEGAARPTISSSGTAPPAKAVRLESPAPVALTPGSITSRSVAATVREHAAEVRACFDRAVMERPDLHGRLAIRATVDPKGSVVSVSPTSTIEAGGRLEACVVSAFKTWTFPKPAGGVRGDISYSFSFE